MFRSFQLSNIWVFEVQTIESRTQWTVHLENGSVAQMDFLTLAPLAPAPWFEHTPGSSTLQMTNRKDQIPHATQQLNLKFASDLSSSQQRTSAGLHRKYPLHCSCVGPCRKIWSNPQGRINPSFEIQKKQLTLKRLPGVFCLGFHTSKVECRTTSSQHWNQCQNSSHLRFHIGFMEIHGLPGIQHLCKMTSFPWDDETLSFFRWKVGNLFAFFTFDPLKLTLDSESLF